jgi:ADP-ribose pyrophosphatase
MKILNKKIIYKGKYLKVLTKDFITKEGKRGKWEYVERKNAVVIFPLTKNREVILEKIYRIPLNSFAIELPAGLLDKKKETPEKTAKRELLEETGYLAKKLIPIISSPFNTGLEKTEWIVFFAPDVKFVGRKETGEAEEIEVIKIPLGRLVEFLMNPPKGTKVEMHTLGILLALGKKGLI